MSFYIKMGNSLFEKIYNASNPLDISFKVISEVGEVVGSKNSLYGQRSVVIH